MSHRVDEYGVLELVRLAEQRVSLPRIEAEPAALRRWSIERPMMFDKVRPVELVTREMATAWIAICVTGDQPGARQVAQIAGLAADEAMAAELLSIVAGITMDAPPDNVKQGVRWLVRSKRAPVDLATRINAALSLEFAAKHVDSPIHQGRLMAVAAVIWWGCGQPRVAARASKIATYLDPTFEFAVLMADVLRYRDRADWMDA